MVLTSSQGKPDFAAAQRVFIPELEGVSFTSCFTLFFVCLPSPRNQGGTSENFVVKVIVTL